MTMVKKIALILTIMASMFLSVACSDISMSDTGSGYTVTITNGTGGYLAEMKVGETTCTDLAPDAACVANYIYRPVELEITYTAKQVLGYPAAADLFTKTVTRVPEVGTKSYEETIALDTSWVSVWVENFSDTYAVDLLGIGTSIGATIAASSLTSYGEYTGITDEEIGFTNVETAVSGNLANTGTSNVKIYATVTGEQLTHDFEETVTGTGGTLTFDGSAAGCQIMKNSVVVKGQITGNDPVVIATDDGTDAGGNKINLVSGNGSFDTAASNTVDVLSGVVAFTLAGGVTYDTYTVSYRYVTALNHSLKQAPKADSVILKMGSAVLSEDTSAGVFKGEKLVGDNSTIVYSTGVFNLVMFPEMYDKNQCPDHITVEYAYEIGADDGMGALSGSGIDGAQARTIDYATGKIDFSFDTTTVAVDRTAGIFAEHTVTALHCDYHFPYALKIEGNFTAAEAPAGETLPFDADTRMVNGKLSHTFIDSDPMVLRYDGAYPVEITVTYTDPADTASTETKIVYGAGDEKMYVEAGATDTEIADASINFTTGRVTFKAPVPDVAARAISAVSVNIYDYFTAGSSNKIWAGFFKKSDFINKSFYVMSMTDADVISASCDFTGEDLELVPNDNGSLILNLICGEDWL